ncbi:MAG: pyruvate formate lyase family protein [Coriobacteriales bacterium]|nr:pyruvate formate lyase family protein [Coriobacteriales bacterium]
MSDIVTWSPVSKRVQRLRNKYRSTKPAVCTARLRLITDYYREHLGEPGLIIRSGSFKHVCETMPIVIRDDEEMAGNVTVPYRGTALFPEGGGIGWLAAELKSGDFENRILEPYAISEEDKEVIYECTDFWEHNSNASRVDACCPDGLEAILGNGVLRYRGKGGRMHGGPVGHFCTNYNKMLTRGFASVRDEAQAKMDALEGHIFGDDMGKYHFYKAVATVSEGAIVYAERVAKACHDEAIRTRDPKRKAELEVMASNYDHLFKNPVSSYLEAVQALFLYQVLLTLDGNLHGMSWGRIDQYLGRYYEADIASGRLTPVRAQEILDEFFLRVAEMNRVGPARISTSAGGYTSGQLMTLGGITRDGRDASNAVSYMMLQSSARLQLHDPTMALRVNKATPQRLLIMAEECTKRVGGIPTFENDSVIIPMLKREGHDEESANNYCLIGCVEPGGCGDEWPAPGGSGGESYFNLANVLIQAVNDGINPVQIPKNAPGKHTGPRTGYLYDMTSFDQVLDAYRAQLEFFVNWHVTMANMFEYASRDTIPVPLVSAMMDGCMEKGVDCMSGGAKYNSVGVAGVGIGTTADSLNVIRELVYERGECTGRELYDAIMANWEGYDDLRDKARNEVPHYGNGDPEADAMAKWVADLWCSTVNACIGPRGKWKAGLWSIARHVADGKVTNATPDGRKLGDPLSDGISPIQGADHNGPTGVLRSVATIDHGACHNGTLLNMRFHPTALANEEDVTKFVSLVRTYFEMGGMELQFNMVSADTMRKAQRDPEDYKDLVVRVAGFSAYFTELHPGLQDEVISRTEETFV